MAQTHSPEAQARAEKEARAVALIRALDSNARCLAELRRHRESYVKGRPILPLQLRIEALLIDMAQWSVRWLDALVPPAATPPQATPHPRYDPDDFRAWLPRAG